VSGDTRGADCCHPTTPMIVIPTISTAGSSTRLGEDITEPRTLSD
jgi:hypothetical protein